MSVATQAGHAYLRNAVLTATHEQLHLMLLDGAVKFGTLGRQRIEQGDIEGAFHALERAQKIVLELQNGLSRDANPELADRMIGLYGFIYRRLVEGNFHRQLKPVDEALHFLREQRQTWQILMDRIAREAPPELRTTPRTEVASLSLQG